jgi:hypothetical protein
VLQQPQQEHRPQASQQPQQEYPLQEVIQHLQELLQELLQDHQLVPCHLLHPMLRIQSIPHNSLIMEFPTSHGCLQTTTFQQFQM